MGSTWGIASTRFPRKGNYNDLTCTASAEASQPATEEMPKGWGPLPQTQACSLRAYLDIQAALRTRGAGESHGLGQFFKEITLPVRGYTWSL